MFVSIALATFNGSKYIKKQLESFAAQSTLPSELIICDDGSTDDTVEIISKFKKTAPFIIKIIQNAENLGHVQNFAKAMALCSGDIVFLSDQDDMWFPNKIETVIQVFQQNPNCWVVIHDGELTDGQLVPSGQTKMSQIRRGYGIAERVSTGALSAIRRDLLKFALPIPSGIIAHDTWLHQLASLLTGRRVILEQSLQYIRRHDENTSSWIVNNDRKLSRLDVIRAQAKTAPASDYTDRLALNTGLTNAVKQMYSVQNEPSDLDAALRAKTRLASERKAIYSRQALLEHSSFKRKLYANYMLMSGQYVHFNGIRSFIRDITR